MTRTRSTVDMTEEGTFVKVEAPVDHDSAETAASMGEGTSNRSFNKRKRRTQHIDLVSEGTQSHRQVKMEALDVDLESTPLKPTPRSRGGPVGRFKETCKHYKQVFEALHTPSRVAKDLLPEFYKKSMELNAFMKAEYDEKHEEWCKLSKAKLQMNAKVNSQKRAVIEGKEARQKSEIRAEVYERTLKDAQLQLTLKVARPLSHAQIKLENAHEDFAAEMALLRLELAKGKADKEADQAVHEATARELAELRARTFSQTSEDHCDSCEELEHVRSLYKSSKLSVDQLTATNTQLEAMIIELSKVSSDSYTDSADSLGEREALQETIRELHEKLKEQAERAFTQSAGFWDAIDALKSSHQSMT